MDRSASTESLHAPPAGPAAARAAARLAQAFAQLAFRRDLSGVYPGAHIVDTLVTS
jgi:hypothetical protein